VDVGPSGTVCAEAGAPPGVWFTVAAVPIVGSVDAPGSIALK
jgi:hypothetical protein